MAKVKTPSNKTITDGQIEKAVDIFRSALCQHGKYWSQDVFQKVLGDKKIGALLVAPFRAGVEAITKMIVCTVENVNRDLSSKEVIVATGRGFHGDWAYLRAFPTEGGDSEDITFVPVEEWMSLGEVDCLVADGGWQYASLHGLAKFNKDNPDFANEVPNFIQAKDAEGHHCHVAFRRFRGERRVYVNRREGDWHGSWFVAVSPASST